MNPFSRILALGLPATGADHAQWQTTNTVAIPQSPLPPSITWVRNGANLMGFPTFKNGANFPTLSSYFATLPASPPA